MKIVISNNTIDNVGTAVKIGNGVDAEVVIDGNSMTNINMVLEAEGIPAVTPEITKLIVAAFTANAAQGREEAIKAVSALGPVKEFFVNHGYPLAQIGLAVAQIVQAAGI